MRRSASSEEARKAAETVRIVLKRTGAGTACASVDIVPTHVGDASNVVAVDDEGGQQVPLETMEFHHDREFHRACAHAHARWLNRFSDI